MGSVQRLATVVIVGLVALATLLVLYLADESNRIEAEEEEQQERAIEHATRNYLSLCVSCHGPAGEGSVARDGRIGLPLGGPMTSTNQQGVNSQGTPVPGGLAGRAQLIRETIANGRGTLMPAWSEAKGGPLNDEQINELVILIQHADWNRIYNEAVHTAGGYPTAPPRATATEAAPAETPAADGGPPVYIVDAVDVAFEPTELTIPADTDVIVRVENKGAAPHNFAIDALGISVDVAPGETKDIPINAPAGEYEYYCNVPGHRESGMVGKLIVDPNAAPPAGTGGEAPAAGTPADGGAAAEPVTVVSKDIFFEPTEITIPANADVTFVLPNEGAAPHNFAIDQLGISVDLQPGETKEVVINAPPGEYEYYCNVPGHRESGMVGKLIVQ